MPLVFIITGIVGMLVVFNYIKFKNQLSKTLIILSSGFILLGFFSKNIFVGSVCFNFYFFLAWIILFLFCIFNARIWVRDLIIIFVIGIAYYIFISDNASFLVGYEDDLIKLSIVIFSLLLRRKFYSGLGSVLLLSMIVVVASGYVGLNNFSVILIDFYFCLEMSIIASLVYFIKRMLFEIFSRRINYEKNVFVNNLASSLYI